MGWPALRPIQAKTIFELIKPEANKIDSVPDCLISAPTAGGKTQAALLPLCHRFLALPKESRQQPGFRILYISPLKALIHQQSDRSREVQRLADVVEKESECKFGVLPWDGDVSDSRKKTGWAKPSGILLITPESIEGRLIHDPLGTRLVLGSLDAIVVDELHAYFDTNRGRQLITLLARLDALTDTRKLPRIALSATLGNSSTPDLRDRDVARLKRFLRPDLSRPFVVLTEAGLVQKTTALPETERFFDLRLNVELETPGDEFVTFDQKDREEELQEEELEEAGLFAGANKREYRSALSPGQSRIVNKVITLFKDFGRVAKKGKNAGELEGQRSALVFANSRQLVEDLTSFLNLRSAKVEPSKQWKKHQQDARKRLKELTERHAKAKDPEKARQLETIVNIRKNNLARFEDSRRYWPHHGSLHKSQRHHAELRMSEGTIGCVLVCTTTLELGIDVGAIENVVQIGAGPTVASLRQRLGRSRRQAQMDALYDQGSKSRPELDMFVVEMDGKLEDIGLISALKLQTFQALAQLVCLRERAYESPRDERLDLSTLIQQILCCLRQAEKGGALTKGALRTLLTERGPFRNAAQTKLLGENSPTIFDALIDHLGSGKDGIGWIKQEKLGALDPNNPHLYLTEKGRKRSTATDIYAAFMTADEYTVRTNGGKIGSLDLRVPISQGQFITLRGRGWEVQQVDRARREILVRAARTGRAPRFPGEPIPVSGLVATKMRDLYCLKWPALKNTVKNSGIVGEGLLESLEEGHGAFHKAGLGQSNKIDIDGAVYIFPWRGHRHLNAYLAVLRACMVTASALGPAIVVPGTSQEHLVKIVRSHADVLRKLPLHELVRDFVSRPNGKFDEAIEPIFWRHDFVSDRLSQAGVEQALAELQKE